MSATLPVRHQRAERFALEGAGQPGLCVYRVGNRVGESPVWDDDNRCLWWIDVRAPEVLRLVPAEERLTRWTLPEPVGALGLATSNRLVLALRNRIVLFDWTRDSLADFCTVADEPACNRLNDGKVSPGGRWFVFGSMDDSPPPKQPSGALYCLAADGALRCLAEGLVVTNGIAFSADGATLFYSDSQCAIVWRADWNEEQGTARSPRIFASLDEARGRPDGAAVMHGGDYLSAGVSAGCLNRFGNDGTLLQRLELPCRAPTMPCFGGDDLRDLYVTSLVRPGWRPDEPPSFDGDLFCVSSDAAGIATARFGEQAHAQGPRSHAPGQGLDTPGDINATD